MPDTDQPGFAALIGSASLALKERKDEVNRLNVFPVPDGDTGTNMSLTMDAVVAEVQSLPGDAPAEVVCRAVTHSSLMGARGNSGVILSQILRGLCEGIAQAPDGVVDSKVLAEAFQRSVTVAFQAVRKPIEGTMLTVIRDAADAAVPVSEEGGDLKAVLTAVVDAAYASVRRTPDLLPVLAEAGVVDAGGYGLAILLDGAVAALDGHAMHRIEVDVTPTRTAETMVVTPADDWDDEEYLYCTEFLLFGEALDRDSLEDWVAGRGGSELVVGDPSSLKVHVHTDDPAGVLAHATSLGEVAEVHVNNMRRQTYARTVELRARQASVPTRALGFVAVAAGSGLVEILKSLGVDEVVSGGQTMNPSTADIVAAVDSVPAETVIVLPNNKNILMAAEQAVPVAGHKVLVVPTTSVPQAFAAMLASDPESDPQANVESMTRAASAVRTGEVTTAVRDSKTAVGAVRAGDVIGIADHEIVATGSDVPSVAGLLLDAIAQDGETLTLLGGEDMDDQQLATIARDLGDAHPELEIETHRGAQPLYPLIMSVE